MNRIQLTDEELRLARSALQAYLQAFGHDEADTVEAVKVVIAKFRAAERDDEDSRQHA
jgi:hypothetical protein